MSASRAATGSKIGKETTDSKSCKEGSAGSPPTLQLAAVVANNFCPRLMYDRRTPAGSSSRSAGRRKTVAGGWPDPGESRPSNRHDTQRASCCRRNPSFARDQNCQCAQPLYGNRRHLVWHRARRAAQYFAMPGPVVAEARPCGIEWHQGRRFCCTVSLPLLGGANPGDGPPGATRAPARPRGPGPLPVPRALARRSRDRRL